MAGSLIRSGGHAPEPPAGRKPPSEGGRPPETARTTSYGGAACYFSRWADLPVAVSAPWAVWDAAHSQVLRSPDGTYRQQVTAWALGEGQLVQITETRPLVDRGDGKLAPNGRWGRPEKQTWRVGQVLRTAVDSKPERSASLGASTPTRTEHTYKAVELLPAKARGQLGPDASVWAVLWKQKNLEEVRGLSIKADHVIVVVATRTWVPRGEWSGTMFRADLASPPAALPRQTRKGLSVGRAVRGMLPVSAHGSR